MLAASIETNLDIWWCSFCTGQAWFLAWKKLNRALLCSPRSLFWKGSRVESWGFNPMGQNQPRWFLATTPKSHEMSSCWHPQWVKRHQPLKWDHAVVQALDKFEPKKTRNKKGATSGDDISTLASRHLEQSWTIAFESFSLLQRCCTHVNFLTAIATWVNQFLQPCPARTTFGQQVNQNFRTKLPSHRQSFFLWRHFQQSLMCRTP